MRPTLLSLAVCIALAHAAPFPIDPDTPGSLQTWTYATPNRGPSRTHRTSKSAADPKRGRKKKPSSLASPVHADGQFDDPEEEPVKNVVKPQAQKSQPQESQPHEAPPAQWTESDKERLDQSEPVTEVVKAEVQKPEVQKPQVQTSQPQKAPPSKWAEGDEEKLSELKEDYQLHLLGIGPSSEDVGHELLVLLNKWYDAYQNDRLWPRPEPATVEENRRLGNRLVNGILKGQTLYTLDDWLKSLLAKPVSPCDLASDSDAMVKFKELERLEAEYDDRMKPRPRKEETEDQAMFHDGLKSHLTRYQILAENLRFQRDFAKPGSVISWCNSWTP